MLMFNLQGAFVYVMRTYMHNQVISFPLGVHVSLDYTRGFLFSQGMKSSFGWRKIDLEEVLNGYRENTDCDGTNGAYRLIKSARNYAALELARPFNASGYTKLGGCVFSRSPSNKITDPNGEPQLPEDGEFSNPPLVYDVGDIIDSGNYVGTNPKFDENGDQIKEVRTHIGDFYEGVANEMVNAEINGNAALGPQDEIEMNFT
jgi:hypothetical protein